MNKKNFYIFLIINAILWICVESMRLVTSADSMEAVVWGDLLSFGTHKHPPLSGWLAGSFHHLFCDSNIGIYVLGNLCVIIGLIFIYKLAKFFLEEKKAMCSSLILTPCFYYTFQLFYDNFNCNILLMALWPMLIYYFYKSVNANKIRDWLILGVLAGLSFIAKYQVVILFMAMFLYMIICELRLFKQKRVYGAVLIALLITAPHLIWLYNTDFFSLLYFVNRTASTVTDTEKFAIVKRLTFSIKFYLDQLLALAPTFVLYAILAFKEKNIRFNNSFKESFKDKMFLLTVGLLPLLAIGATGIFTASRVVGAWGVSMVCAVGILLFYFLPVKFQEGTYKFFLKWIYGMMICWQIAMMTFFLLQTKRDFSYPYDKVMNDFNQVWAQETNGLPLKYVAGDYAISSQIYNVQKPKAILDTYNHKNPWIDYEDVTKSGALLLYSDEKSAKKALKDFTEDYNIESDSQVVEYEYEISNKLNKSRKYYIYYAIVKPQA
ncbi:glycosyltransferase family 39 protein [bacterium]|nr:glycosyltransferase family 39 protein [bacterium]